ncbi:MAG: diadenylate cyclase CdaA [Paludibacteraceae bacterium]|nr:diadenylate cyclase CdaA [Paludibacteraceae bacterium]
MRFGPRFIDYIDIIVVACILYSLYKDSKGTSANRLFAGVLVFIIVWLVVSFVFQMQLLGAIMDQIVNVGAIALIVLFQDEIRQFFTKLGSRQNVFSRFLTRALNFNEQKIENDDIMQIVIACKNMARNKVGALIVIPHNIDLRYIEDTGERIDAKISERLIENIFFKNSPLHDGAMLISNGRIKAASCILPVTHKTDVDPDLGLRHRAALGITEKSDAWAIVVSEETGRISWSEFGRIETGISQEKLEQYLSKLKKSND